MPLGIRSDGKDSILYGRSRETNPIMIAFQLSMRSPVLNVITIWFAVLHGATFATTRDCRCFPGDACWPTQAEWATLNNSVDGRLIATVPLASPCHDPNYNAALCTGLQQNWFLPQQQSVPQLSHIETMLKATASTRRRRLWHPTMPATAVILSRRNPCLAL